MRALRVGGCAAIVLLGFGIVGMLIYEQSKSSEPGPEARCLVTPFEVTNKKVETYVLKPVDSKGFRLMVDSKQGAILLAQGIKEVSKDRKYTLCPHETGVHGVIASYLITVEKE